MTQFLLALIAVCVVVLLWLLAKPNVLRGNGGRLVAFVGLFFLPGLAMSLGGIVQLENSKKTEFCFSCHVMEPYRQSLEIADPSYLPAAHYQNNRVPRSHACYTCHTDYTMYGDVSAKFRGLRHLWVNYLGSIPDKLELYTPYKNRECLGCHGGSRTFEESEMHADIRAELTAEEMSCLECHEFVHDVANLADQEMWKGAQQP
jgi:nitrate/TMAO reductase-like tetraheme cytochrome c subunit